MSNKPKWMCSNCDTEHDSQVDAIYCCQCESCAELKKQLTAVRPYIQHKANCPRQTNLNYGCDCGLQAAIGEVEK